MQEVTTFPVGFILLGTFAEGFAILVLTVPLVQPILESPGVDLIWFGVLMEIVPEMALISLPVGTNVFVARGIAPNVTLNTIIRGILAVPVGHAGRGDPDLAAARHHALAAVRHARPRASDVVFAKATCAR